MFSATPTKPSWSATTGRANSAVVVKSTVQSAVPAELVARIVMVPELTVCWRSTDYAGTVVLKLMPAGEVPSTA